eukprot:scaffold6168_cov420-Prasinococcus_capsulatus_cf.AAC.5
MEAVQFAKEKLKPLCADSQCCLETVQDCLSLLAYSSPEESPSGQYLHQSFRSKIATMLNSALLRKSPLKSLGRASWGLDRRTLTFRCTSVLAGQSGCPPTSPLEDALRQRQVVEAQLSKANQ